MVKSKGPKSATMQNQEGWRLSNTGRLLFNAARRFEDRVIRHINSNGFPDIRMAHMSVPRNLDVKGTRITELAKRCAMTKQSMSDLVNQCERMGLVSRRPDISDYRAKIIVFTAKGRRLLDTIRKAITIAERDLCGKIGDQSAAKLRSILASYLGVNVAK